MGTMIDSKTMGNHLYVNHVVIYTVYGMSPLTYDYVSFIYPCHARHFRYTCIVR